MSQGLPARCTAIIALVFSEILSSTSSGERLNVSGSESAKTGLAPVYKAAFAVATNVSDGTITSSPGFMSSDNRIAWSAAVHELSATACLVPTVSAKPFSSASTFFPDVSHPEVNTVLMFASISSRSSESKKGLENGIFTIALPQYFVRRISSSDQQSPFWDCELRNRGLPLHG